ncbi:hypothetical protein FSP39_002086 [Pinctada imbricata]|uniref:Hexosyltransferase n=1 Tax=Pinctada imbricata TaxID=66713 RepID=A0AA88XVA1_PINIB|nr:hypothetical protein FSP39_002086 [Pinctada imbricata]
MEGLKEPLCGIKEECNLDLELVDKELKAGSKRLKDASQTSSESPKTRSKYFVSFEVRTIMRQRRTSTKVILKASVTTVLVVTLLFIVLYTVLLRYFPPISPLPYDNWRRHRLRLIAKSKPDNHSHINRLEDRQRTLKWNISTILGPESHPLLCRKNIDYLILIMSHGDNYNRRQAIRRTWCKSADRNTSFIPWQCVFVIGQSDSLKGKPNEISETLKHEITVHNDILLGSYYDTYRNLTLKTMHGLHWMNQNCDANIVLKTDDDCFVNTRLLHSLILHHQDSSNLYIGRVMTEQNKRKVIRNPENRWHVLKSAYSLDTYPPYASGAGYLLSKDVVKQFVKICNYVHLIPIEDAYIGLLAEELGVTPINSARFTLEVSGWSMCNFAYIIVMHKVEYDMQDEMWTKSFRAKDECRNSREILTWN